MQHTATIDINVCERRIARSDGTVLVRGSCEAYVAPVVVLTRKITRTAAYEYILSVVHVEIKVVVNAVAALVECRLGSVTYKRVAPKPFDDLQRGKSYQIMCINRRYGVTVSTISHLIHN